MSIAVENSGATWRSAALWSAYLVLFVIALKALSFGLIYVLAGPSTLPLADQFGLFAHSLVMTLAIAVPAVLVLAPLVYVFDRGLDRVGARLFGHGTRLSGLFSAFGFVLLTALVAYYFWGDLLLR